MCVTFASSLFSPIQLSRRQFSGGGRNLWRWLSINGIPFTPSSVGVAVVADQNCRQIKAVKLPVSFALALFCLQNDYLSHCAEMLAIKCGKANPPTVVVVETYDDSRVTSIPRDKKSQTRIIGESPFVTHYVHRICTEKNERKQRNFVP